MTEFVKDTLICKVSQKQTGRELLISQFKPANTHILIKPIANSAFMVGNSNNKVHKKVKVAIAGVGNCASATIARYLILW